MKTAKNILLRVNLKGNGIVNNDSFEQRQIFRGTKLANKFDAFSRFKNTSFAKKNFYNDVNGDLTYKIKISSDCLKNEIFKNDILVQSPNIMGDSVVLNSFMASPTSLIRGYMFLTKNGDSFKKKGAISFTDAEQTCNAVSYIETFSRSGRKEEGEAIEAESTEEVTDETTETKDGKVADNSFYKKETVGNIEYSCIGNIDVKELQFLSADGVFDRLSFNPDKYELFKLLLGTKVPNFTSELGYYQMKNSIVRVPEYGVKLSDENVVFVVQEFLSKLLQTNIKRKGSYAQVTEVEYKIVTNPLVDTFADENGWVSLKSQKDIDSLSFKVDETYIEVIPEEAKAAREEMEKNYQALLNTKKEVKKAATKKNKKVTDA